MDAEQIAEALGGKRYGTGFMCSCPAHNDKTPSFSVKDVDEKTLFHCFAGCSQSEVIEALRNLGLWRTSKNYTYNKLAQKNNSEIRHAKLVIQLARGDLNRGEFSQTDLPTVEKAKAILDKNYG